MKIKCIDNFQAHNELTLEKVYDVIKDKRKENVPHGTIEHVNHPNHYNKGKFEVIDVIEDWHLGFNLGNAIKYIGRCEHKENKKQDLEKALWYIKRELENITK